MTARACPRCGETDPAAFGPGTNAGGLRTYSHPCAAVYQREYMASHPEQQAKKREQRRRHYMETHPDAMGAATRHYGKETAA